MKDTLSVQVAKRGIITLPKRLRDQYNIREGDDLTLLDLGGTFVLTRQRSQVDDVADRLGALLQESGESLESMLQTLREDRDRVFDEQYPKA